MKASILQTDLARGLNLVNRVVTSRGQLPILSNVLLDAKATGLSLSATNLELGMRVAAGGKVEQVGAVTIPGRNLAEFVGSLSLGTVKLETDGERLKVGLDKSSAIFAGIGASEFPILPMAKSVKPVLAKKGVLQLSAQVAYAAAAEESRPVLTGIKFGLNATGLTAVATDGFRLSRKSIPESDKKTKETIGEGLILPSRTILELARIVAEAEEEAVSWEILKDNNQVVFICGQVELISRVIEGNYPDTEKIIPQTFKTQVTLDRLELVRVLRQVGIFAREGNNTVKWQILSDKMTVFASAPSLGENTTEIEAEVVGEGGTVAFNYKYVSDFLGSTDAERIVFKMNDAVSPGVFVPEKDETLIGLIMPVKTSD